MKRTILVLIITTFLLLQAIPVIASSSFPVTIIAETVFNEPEALFTASGEAVNQGLICSAGTVTDGKYIAAGRWEGPNGPHWNFIIQKVFVCEDGSGSFTINLRAHAYFDPYNNEGTWNVLWGDGDYGSLHGGGSFEGIMFGDGTGVYDIYTGSVHID